MNIIYIMTYDCNLRCKYCDVHKSKKNINKSIINDSLVLLEKNKINIKSIKFFWWEPILMEDKIKYIVKHFGDNRNIKYYLTSNSLLVLNDFINFVKENWINLTFSIDWEDKINWWNRININWEDIWNLIIAKTKEFAQIVRINQVIMPNNSNNVFSNFEYIYNLWVRKYNFLPAYYIPWTKKSLQELKNWFDQILEYNVKWNNFDLVNLENYSEMSFFNKWIVIDTDGKIYWTNLILNKKFEKYKKELVIWNTFDKSLFINKIDDGYFKKIKEMLNKEYSIEVIKSVEYIDLILNNFCNEFQTHWNKHLKTL